MEGDLQKQRRNLLAISAILIIYDVAQVEISKVSILGTELSVKRVGVLLSSLWIMWLYFLLRYYQYWRQGNLSRNFWDRVEERKTELLHRWGQRQADRWFGPEKEGRWLFYNGMKNELMISMQKPRQDHGAEGPHRAYRVPQSIHTALKLRAMVWVSFQTTETTEHFLPFLLAIAAPFVALIVHWNDVSTAISSFAHPTP